MFKRILVLLILSTIGTVFFAQRNNFFSEEMYYMAEVFEILKSEKRDKYLEFFPDEYEDPDYPIFDSDFGDYDESYHDFYHYWYEYIPNKRLSVIKNTYEEMSIKAQRYSSIVWDKEKNLTMTIYCSPYLFVLGDYEIKENEIEFDLWSLAKDNLAYTHTVSINKEIHFSNNDTDIHSAKFIFDGDYLDFYIDDMFIHKFCRINEVSLKEYENLILNNECDLSKVKWPRHADGTSNYDDKIIMPEPNKLIEYIQKMFTKKIESSECQVKNPKVISIEWDKKAIYYRDEVTLTIKSFEMSDESPTCKIQLFEKDFKSDDDYIFEKDINIDKDEVEIKFSVEFEIDKLIDENEKELEIYPKLVYEKKEYTSKEALLFVKIGELRK